MAHAPPSCARHVSAPKPPLKVVCQGELTSALVSDGKSAAPVPAGEDAAVVMFTAVPAPLYTVRFNSGVRTLR